jgi:Amt family ammonium transporter
MGGFSLGTVGVQLVGIGACFVWTFPAAFVMFKLIDMTVGLRVSPEEELEGLDMVEHGGTAYPDFEVSSYTTSPGFGGDGQGSGRREPAATPVPEMGS